MKTRLAVVVLALVFVVAACSSPPTGGQAGEVAPSGSEAGSEAAGGGDAATAQAVLAELEGLEGEERRQRLIELAQEEGEAVTLYTSLNAEILDVVADLFEEQTGIAIDQYRASSESVRDRILQEARAGFRGADVIETNGPEMQIMADQGALQPFTSPVQDDLAEGSVEDGWTATRFNIFAVAWNTDRVAEGEQPTTYQDLADPRWEGDLAMEIADVEWYRAVWKYLVEDEGLTEEEADGVFEDMATNATFLSGHTTFRQLLVAGEYAVVASDYSYGIDAAAAEGAPVAWQPPVEPLFARANGAALAAGAPRPASAVLLMEWLLTDGQEILLDQFLTPARADLIDTGEADVRTIDIGEFLAEQEEWAARYEELQRFGEVAEG